jgi:hypothetical protein
MYCPACGAGLVSEPIGAPLRCKNCRWHLVTRTEWKRLSPSEQGYIHYRQCSWPTSELADEKNPYKEGTPAWTAFREGAARATMSAQDGEE